EVDKKYFLEVYNFSIIPYSAKWFYLEPEEGKPFYDDLDAYVNWCLENKIGIEYHFVTGYPPKWLETKPPEEKQQQLLKHSNELIDRYGGKIDYWQVVNEKHLLTESVAAFKLFRQRLPDAKLGISDCARFYSPHQAGSQARFDDLTRGLQEIHWLKEQGVELDFFGFHGHRPFGLWADFRVLYEALDVFEKEGIRIHISEFGIHEVHNIEGDVVFGQWNADLQGRYYEMIYSAMFSHPVVDAINMWGMSANTWMTGSGLLDKDGQPKPSFHALRNLIHKKWRTSKKGVLPLSGKINCRAFYGDYLLRLELADGKKIDIPFQHRRGETKPLIFSIDNKRVLRVE
ncbi:endo-1,4-beta-xylanase, partial [bacterium]|nr:endo-1,4-beta-xylanase [bacterium]